MGRPRLIAVAALAALCACGKHSSPGLPPGSYTVVLGGVAGPETAPDPTPNPPCALPVKPAVTRAGVLELGVHAVGDALAFDLPAASGSFSVVAQEVDGSAPESVAFGSNVLANGVLPNDLRAPGISEAFFDVGAALSTSDGSDLFAFDFPIVSATGAFTVPNTGRALGLVQTGGGALPAGTWTFTLTDLARECSLGSGCMGGSTAGRYDVKILTLPGPTPAKGSLDLDVYLVSDRFQAAAAAADPASSSQARVFRRFLSGIAFLLERAGVTLRTVRIRDVAAWAQAEFTSPNIDGTGACSDLGRLFGLSASEDAVHLFLVDDLTSSNTQGGGLVVGVDGSIPGPSGIPGSPASGAAAVTADLGAEARSGGCGGGMNLADCGTDLVAYVAAHEIGHWLGLYHPTEVMGTSFDPLTDTPTCECDACAATSQKPLCASDQAVVSARRCARAAGACAGGGNLMFWSVDPAVSAGSLSPEQGAVMRANPVVQ